MGILEFVRNEHAGLIPRAIAQIFDYVDGNEGRIDMTISLSFLQLYRESIQDLLSQASGNNSPSEDNLLIREDPIKGFYVEGLQEFVVRSYLEAGELNHVNLIPPLRCIVFLSTQLSSIDVCFSCFYRGFNQFGFRKSSNCPDDDELHQ